MLASRFRQVYDDETFGWQQAPMRPRADTYFDGEATYDRPGAAYLALRRILGAQRFDAVLRDLQRRYGGGSVTRAQWQAAFTDTLPVQTSACRQRMGAFFTQWFDTAYPARRASRPSITGPGLPGSNFYDARCPAPRR